MYAFSLVTCIQRYVEWTDDHFDLGLMYIGPPFTKILAKNDFHIFVPNDIDLLPLDLKFSPIVSCLALCFH